MIQMKVSNEDTVNDIGQIKYPIATSSLCREILLCRVWPALRILVLTVISTAIQERKIREFLSIDHVNSTVQHNCATTHFCYNAASADILPST